jgi:excisionase family DNA binding protein
MYKRDESHVDQEPLLYSISDTCRMLSIGRTSVYKLMDEGELVPVKLGKRLMIPRERLIAFVDKLMESA